MAWERARNVAIGEGMAASTYLPVITANVLGGYQGANGENSTLGAGIHNSGNVFGSVEAVSVEWLLFDFGGRKNIVGAARKLSDASNIAFTGAHQQVIYAVSIAYYAYVAAVERHHIAIEALANAKEIEAASEARYAHGEGTVLETAQTRNLTAQAKFSMVNAQGAEDQAYAALLVAMGVSPLETIRIAPATHHSLSTDDLEPGRSDRARCADSSSRCACGLQHATSKRGLRSSSSNAEPPEDLPLRHGRLCERPAWTHGRSIDRRAVAHPEYHWQPMEWNGLGGSVHTDL